jgi:hypothetical protein
VLRRRAQQLPYTPGQTVNWLGWLAHQMDVHGQTVFDLERPQLNWLPRRQRKTTRICTGLGIGLVFGPVFVLVGGLVGGMQTGGETCLKHIVLRLALIRNGSTPWNYVRFLDYASERILLRKVGGGYAFIHRMLLDHFAARYRRSSVIDIESES